jgi:MFS family permease
MAKRTLDPVGTLSVGNIITTAVTLYKSNFRRYVQVSLRATGWVLAIVLSAIGLTVIAALLYGLNQSSIFISIPLGLVWLVFAAYCVAKSNTNRAVIARLAYQESIDRPETVSAATQQLQPRTWAFLRLAVLIVLYMYLILLVSYIPLLLLLGVIGYLGSLLVSSLGAPIYFILGLLAIGLFFGWIILLMRYYAGWFIAELPLAIESRGSASISLRRSRELSKAFTGRIVLILTIAFGVTLPITLLGNLASVFGQIAVDPRISPNSSNQTVGFILIGVGFLLSTVGDLFVMPFWQVIKAVIYQDLCNRREGSDLNL